MNRIAETASSSTSGLVRETIVLASSSPTRAAMLERAGLAVEIDRPRVDEDEIKRSMRAEGFDAAAAAETLAEQKARSVARRHAGALVVGADQILECGDQSFDKPADIAAAREQLRALAGRRHELISAACIVMGTNKCTSVRTVPRKPGGDTPITVYPCPFSTISQPRTEASLANQRCHNP